MMAYSVGNQVLRFALTQGSIFWIDSAKWPRQSAAPDFVLLPVESSGDMDAFASKLIKRQSVYEDTHLNMQVPEDGGGSDDDDDDDSVVKTLDEQGLKKHGQDIDYCLTVGINLKCLTNPMYMRLEDWTRKTVEQWLCRVPQLPKDTLNLVSITHFRRYGMRETELELKCVFQPVAWDFNTPPGRLPRPLKNKGRKSFWVHAKVLANTSVYYDLMRAHYKWDWTYAKDRFHEVLDGYGSDQFDMLSTDTGEICLVSALSGGKTSAKRHADDDGNCYSVHPISVMKKHFESQRKTSCVNK